MAKIKQTIDTSKEDREFIEKFQNELTTFLGCTIEMFLEHKVLLLSQCMRELILDKAKKIQTLFLLIKDRICVDNPGENLPCK